MDESAAPENDNAAPRDLDAALQRLLEHALGDRSGPVDAWAVRHLALELVACCDRIAMAEAVDAFDDHADDAFTRFMHGDGERVLIAFAN